MRELTFIDINNQVRPTDSEKEVLRLENNSDLGKNPKLHFFWNFHSSFFSLLGQFSKPAGHSRTLN